MMLWRVKKNVAGFYMPEQYFATIDHGIQRCRCCGFLERR